MREVEERVGRATFTLAIWLILPVVIRLSQRLSQAWKYRHSLEFIRLDFGTGLLERVGTGIVGTIGYVVLPTGVSTDVSRDIV